jgi:hypothetical protein
VGVTDADITEWFSAVGPIDGATVMLDVSSGISRGFAFVLYRSAEDAAQAVKQLHNKVIGDSVLHIRLSHHDGRRVVRESRRVLARNIPLHLTLADLQHFFEQFGSLTGCLLRRDAVHSNGTLHTVTVTFAQPSAAAAAVAAVHGKTPLPGCTVPLLARLTDSSGDQRQPLFATELSTAAQKTEQCSLIPQSAYRPQVCGATPPYSTSRPMWPPNAFVPFRPFFAPSQPTVVHVTPPALQWQVAMQPPSTYTQASVLYLHPVGPGALVAYAL